VDNENRKKELDPMVLRKILFATSLTFFVLCLGAGYVTVGQWLGAIFTMITALAWIMVRKYPTSWLPHICLVVSVGLAAAGILTGSPAVWMIMGSGMALVVWDLLFLNDALGDTPNENQTRRYENRHLQSLAISLGAGLLAALLGRFIHLQISFILVVFFIALAVFGLDRLWVYDKKR
jgi:hypothetical protein